MHRTKVPLRQWFWAAYFVATSTPGLSTLQLKKQLGGHAHYETVYMLMAKLRAGMRRPGRGRIGGQHPVELDVIYVGGTAKGGGRGASRKKVPVALAVEVREGDPPSNIREAVHQNQWAGRVRMRHLPNNDAKNINKFVKDWITPGSLIISDDGSSFAGIADAGYVHEPVTIGPDKTRADAWLPLSSLVASNFKAWWLGTFHGAIRRKHLQEYLDEYAFRFNRRFWSMSAFRTLLQIGTQVAPLTYADQYAGRAVRQNPASWPPEVLREIEEGPEAVPGRRGRRSQ